MEQRSMIKDFGYRVMAVVAACFATPWAAYHQRRIRRLGRKLTEDESDLAKKLGVSKVDQIFVMAVELVPNPMRLSFGLLEKCGGPCVSGVDGITLGHGIYVSLDAADSLELMVHELVHVGQYERVGSIWRFMIEYIHQCLMCGYHAADWEIEARRESAKALS